jgi:hypothetical protein
MKTQPRTLFSGVTKRSAAACTAPGATLAAHRQYEISSNIPERGMKYTMNTTGVMVLREETGTGASGADPREGRSREGETTGFSWTPHGSSYSVYERRLARTRFDRMSCGAGSF